MTTCDEKSLRDLYDTLPPAAWRQASYESELKVWRETNRFCGRCGVRMEPHADAREHAMVCPSCGYMAYPRVTPAVIVLVKKGDRILLQRNSHYRLPHWSLVAGFVDPAETFEEAAVREVREESKLEIGHLRYFGSQIWPFPSNVMAGYVADWTAGEPTPDGEEVVASRWFGRAELPLLPKRVSIARKMVDAWLDGLV
ncbi:MAG: NAD(+) diphosphatase [Kiritimatiellia bacterium]